MEIQEKHRLEILNAKCNYACAVDILQKKMSYGEDVSCCINKLYLASRLINRLECYCFPTVSTINTKYQGALSFTQNRINLVSDGDYYLTSNGVRLYKYTAKDLTMSEVVKSLLDGYSISYTRTLLGETYDLYTFSNTCDNLSYEVYFSTTLIESTNTRKSPTCEYIYTTCYNCINTYDLPKMYEILHKLLS